MNLKEWTTYLFFILPITTRYWYILFFLNCFYFVIVDFFSIMCTWLWGSHIVLANALLCNPLRMLQFFNFFFFIVAHHVVFKGFFFIFVVYVVIFTSSTLGEQLTYWLTCIYCFWNGMEKKPSNCAIAFLHLKLCDSLFFARQASL